MTNESSYVTMVSTNPEPTAAPEVEPDGFLAAFRRAYKELTV